MADQALTWHSAIGNDGKTYWWPPITTTLWARFLRRKGISV